MKTIKIFENKECSVRLPIDYESPCFSSPYRLQRYNDFERKLYLNIWHSKTSPKKLKNLLDRLCIQLNGKKTKTRLHRLMSSIKGRNVTIKAISVKEIVGTKHIVIEFE